MSRLRSLKLDGSIANGLTDAAVEGPWIRVPEAARLLYFTFHSDLGGVAGAAIHLQTTADPSAGTVTTDVDNHTYGPGIATYAGPAKTEFLSYVRLVVNAGNGIVNSLSDVRIDYEIAPFAPTTFTFDLLVGSVAPTDALTRYTPWRKIPDEALVFYGILNAESAGQAGDTLDVTTQVADDATGANAADLHAFAQVTHADERKLVDGPHTNFKYAYIRAKLVAASTRILTANVDSDLSAAAPIEDVVAAPGAGNIAVVLDSDLTFTLHAGTFFYFCDHAMSPFIPFAIGQEVHGVNYQGLYFAHENLGVDLKMIGAGVAHVAGPVKYVIVPVGSLTSLLEFDAGVRVVAR